MTVAAGNGFATVRANGTRRLYSVRPEALQEVDVWLERFRNTWSQHLDALATDLARGKRERQVEKLPPDDHAGERIGVSLRRTYDSPIEDVWDAVTDPERTDVLLAGQRHDARVGTRSDSRGQETRPRISLAIRTPPTPATSTISVPTEISRRAHPT